MHVFDYVGVNNNGQKCVAIGGIDYRYELHGGADPKSALPVGDQGRCLTQLLETARVSLPNGMISFRPAALAVCTSVTDDIHTDRQTTLW